MYSFRKSDFFLRPGGLVALQTYPPSLQIRLLGLEWLEMKAYISVFDTSIHPCDKKRWKGLGSMSE